MPSWPLSLSFIVPPHSEKFGFGGALKPQAYLERLSSFMRAAERIGVTGAFVYDFPVALDPWLVAGLIRQESYFNPHAVSVANARGLMQVLPSVGEEVAKRYQQYLSRYSPSP